MTPYDWANGGSIVVFYVVRIVLVMWGVGAILKNRYGIQGQNHVA